jgi:hypothetical protein
LSKVDFSSAEYPRCALKRTSENDNCIGFPIAVIGDGQQRVVSSDELSPMLDRDQARGYAIIPAATV